MCNLFIYQARGVYPGPSRVSNSQVSAGNIVYKTFVLMGELRRNLSSLLQSRKVKTSLFVFF